MIVRGIEIEKGSEVELGAEVEGKEKRFEVIG